MRFGHAIGLGLAALGAAAALSGCGSASASPPLPSYAGTLCPAQPNGEPCIKVLDRGHVVRDVIGYLSASDSPLAGKTWRLVLSRYNCDPGSAARPTCSAAATYPGPTRHGNAPQADVVSDPERRDRDDPERLPQHLGTGAGLFRRLVRSHPAEAVPLEHLALRRRADPRR